MPMNFPDAPTNGDVYTSGGISYSWDGLTWSITAAAATATVGDVKSGFQPADHAGWIKLDGRAVSMLTATQQAAAATLGFAANLPDATDAVMRQQAGALGAVGGSWKITQAMLPAINLTANMGNTANTTTSQAAGTAATSSEAPDHHHPMQACTNDGGTVGFSELLAEYPGSSGGSSGGKVWRRPSTIANVNNGNLWMTGRGMDYAGKHTHTMNVPAHTHTVDIPDHNHLVPLGGTGADFLPKVVIANAFLYLGV